ncbi:MAG: hypothetical protein AB7Y46_06840 [Armatimonadota bacterium]
MTVNHAQVRGWASRRGAEPGVLAAQGSPDRLELIMPGDRPCHLVGRVSWDEFLRQFDDQRLALLYREGGAWHRFVPRWDFPLPGLPDMAL